MPGPDGLDTEQLMATLERQEELDLLRFLTCGSVDDGKSTLIGRMLFEAGQIFEDQLAGLEVASRRHGTTGEAIDLALLVDGLQAEREQGITIDVAYRFFTTDRRKFIVADTPGHVQYTRNMATGASSADLAVILVDARQGILTQTRRHAFIVSLMGIRDVVLAVNKMDLVDWDEARFRAIEAEFRAFADRVGLRSVTAIPVSALTGDNVVAPGKAAAWFDGPTLLTHLESVDIPHDDPDRPMRLPVQWVSRPDRTFRGYAGTLVSGQLAPGDAVRALPSGRDSRVDRIVTAAGDLDRAIAGQAITVTLTDEIDVSRGDMLVPAAQPPQVADQFQARLIWMNDVPMLPGRPYELRLGMTAVPASITTLKHRIDVDTLDERPGRSLALNEVGVATLATDRPIAFDPYAENRDTGGFILIDRMTNETVGAGMIDFALRRATNVVWQAHAVDRPARSRLKGHRPAVLWFTGLSGAGKSTIADRVETRLAAQGVHTYLIDGDNVRHGLNKDLGFTEADRVENIRRVAEVARMMAEAGLVCLVSLISPYRADRRMARDLMDEGDFVEIFVDTPLAVCEDRDIKGLYRRARAGEIPNFTGVSAPYEAPEAPELTVDGSRDTPDTTAEAVIAWMEEAGYL